MLFGVITIAPKVWDEIPIINRLYARSNKLLGWGYRKQNILGDLIVGAALGPVFSACSPTYFVILATVLPASAAEGVVYLAAYTIGLCISLFIVARLGQKTVVLLGITNNPKKWFRKTIGVLFVGIGIAVMFGLDKQAELALPPAAFGEARIEQWLLGLQFGTLNTPTTALNQNLGSSSGNEITTVETASTSGFLSLSAKATLYRKAPEFVSPTGFINTGGKPITLAEYLGKDVVLIDFWSYNCEGCLLAIPYLNKWYDNYGDRGFVVIGIYTPTSAPEYLLSNVKAKVEQLGIKYPIVLNNEFKTENAFYSEFSPHLYLINIDGYIVYDLAGEGEFGNINLAIHKALAERSDRLGSE